MSAPRFSWLDRAGLLPEIAILAVAALTRFWRLGYHSIWFDEAVSLKWADADVGYTWRVTLALVEEKHPPVYYVFLHYWQEVLRLFGLGKSDAWLRASGAALGVLAVLALLLLARRLSGRRVALAAGLLAALAPALVWYSQELRMFQPAAAALLWGGYFLVRAWQGATGLRRLGWWLGMAAAFLAALYAYLFSALALPAAGLSLLLLWANDTRAGARRFGRLAEGIAAFAGVALLFLPLARNAWLVNNSEGMPSAPFANVGDTALHLLQVFSVWRPDWPEWLVLGVALLAGTLALLGLLLPGRDRPGWTDRIWLALWLGLPFAIGNLLLATSDSIFGEDRYFLFLAPVLLWAAARGAVALGERVPAAGWAAGGALAVALVAALPVLWTPERARENWRAAADLIIQHTEASGGLPAAAVAHVDYTHLPLEWYIRPRMSGDKLALYFPFGGTLTEESADAIITPPLQGIEDAGYDTLWLTQSHLEGVDDARLVQRWLDARYPLITEAFPAGIHLRGYAIQSRYDALPPNVQSAPVEMVPGLTLAACEITTPQQVADDDFLHPPSGWVHVRLWWQGTGPIDGAYTARVRVANEAGVWGESLARDSGALRRLPTSTWDDSRFVRDEVDVNMNPVTPPGDYAVSVRLLDASGAEAGSETPCGVVTIVAQ